MNGSQFHDFNFIDTPLAGVSAAGTDLVSGIRSDITSWVELAAIVTLGAELPVILEWFDPTVGLVRTVYGTTGSDATDTSIGVQRADDWADSGVVWYQVGGAG